MNETISGIVRKLLTQYGTDLLNDRKRLEGLLLDRIPGKRKETGLLMMAARENIADELAALSERMIELPVYNRLVNRLCQDVGLDESNARWAVETWAEALGKELPDRPDPDPQEDEYNTPGSNPAAAPLVSPPAAQQSQNATSGSLTASSSKKAWISIIAGIAIVIIGAVLYASLWAPDGKDTAAVSSEDKNASASTEVDTAAPAVPEEETVTDSEAGGQSLIEDTPLFPFHTDQGAGYIDQSGKVVIEPQFDSASEFHDGLAAASLNGKEGFIDKTGQWVISAQYEVARYFSDGLARVIVNNHFVYIDKTGSIVLDKDIGENAIGDAYFTEGLLPVSMNDSIGYVDTTGKVVIPAQFDFGYEFHDGLALVEKGGKRFFIDRTGTVVIPNSSDYYFAVSFAEGMARIEKGASQYGFIDKSGQVVIEPDFEYLSDFSEGLAAAEKGGKFGFIDKTGAWIIEPQFAYAGDFHNDMAMMRNDQFEWGYVNRQGEIVVPYSLSSADDFENGLAWIERDEEPYYINTSGEVVWSKAMAAADNAAKKEASAVSSEDVADRSRFHAQMRGMDGQLYDFYLFADDESRSVVQDPSGMANEGDIMYSGEYKAAIGQNGKLHIKMLSEDGEEPLSFNDSRKMITKLPSADPINPDLLAIAQYGTSNGDLISFYILGDDAIIPLTLRYDASRTEDELFASSFEALTTPMEYQSRAYDNSVGTWSTITWKLDTLHHELILTDQVDTSQP